MIADGTSYQDLAPITSPVGYPTSTVAKLANRIRKLGFEVEIGTPA